MTFLVLILAFFLRIVLINDSLWLDESIEALALMGKFGPILTYALGDFQPPLYHLLTLGLTSIFGFSEIILRIPSLVAGVLTVYFVMRLANLLFGKKTANLAGLLAATNPLLIYYSAEGRTYAMTCLFVTASWYYLSLWLKKPDGRTRLAYFLFATLSLWTSYLAWFVVGLQALYLMAKKEKLFLASLLSFSTLVIWLPSLVQSARIASQTLAISPAWGGVVGGISLKAIVLTWVKMVIGRISFTNTWLYGTVLAIMGILHALVLRFRPKNYSLYLWIFGSVFVSALISLVVPVYSYFRLLFILPAYLLLLAYGIDKSGIKSLWAVFVFSNFIFLSIYWLTPRFHKEDWRSLVQFLQNENGAALALPSLAQSAPLTYYGLSLPLLEPQNGVTGDYQTVYYLPYVEEIFDGQGRGRANLVSAGYQETSSLSFNLLPILKYEKN